MDVRNMGIFNLWELSFIRHNRDPFGFPTCINAQEVSHKRGI